MSLINDEAGCRRRLQSATIEGSESVTRSRTRRDDDRMGRSGSSRCANLSPYYDQWEAHCLSRHPVVESLSWRTIVEMTMASLSSVHHNLQLLLLLENWNELIRPCPRKVSPSVFCLVGVLQARPFDFTIRIITTFEQQRKRRDSGDTPQREIHWSVRWSLSQITACR